MKTRISTKGQIVLPAEFREQDRIQPGEQFDVERLDAGNYRLTRVSPPRNQGLVDLLLACPVKDWFQPMDRSETIADIKIPKVG